MELRLKRSVGVKVKVKIYSFERSLMIRVEWFKISDFFFFNWSLIRSSIQSGTEVAREWGRVKTHKPTHVFGQSYLEYLR